MKTNKELEQFKKNKSVDYWLTALQSQKAGSSGTTYQYTHALKRFCDFSHVTPDQLIKEVKGTYDLPRSKFEEVKTQARHRINKFVVHLEKQGLAPNSIKRIKTSIASFYRHNDLDELKIRTYHAYPVKLDRAPTKKELRKLIELANERDTALVLLLATSGLRIGTSVKLTVGDIDLTAEEPITIKIPHAITKGKYSAYTTYTTNETAEAIKEYLDHRRHGTRKIKPEHVTPSSPLFRARYNEVKTMTPESATSQMHDLIFRAQLNKPDTKERVKTHSIRKWFKSQLAIAGISDTISEHYLGHTNGNGMSAIYTRLTETELRDAYTRALPNLKILEPEIPREQLNGFEQEIEALKETVRLQQLEIEAQKLLANDIKGIIEKQKELDQAIKDKLKIKTKKTTMTADLEKAKQLLEKGGE